jgi:uncharacterized membrane protein
VTPRARLARALHGLFDGTLIVKAVLATLEAAGGAGLWLTPNASVHALVGWLTRNQIAHAPGERAVQWFAQTSAGFSVESQHFYAFYLMAHGAIKLAMVFLLARRVPWAYPASVLLLGCFIAYQMHHWTETHSSALLLLSTFDALMIALVLREYRGLRRQHRAV